LTENKFDMNFVPPKLGLVRVEKTRFFPVAIARPAKTSTLACISMELDFILLTDAVQAIPLYTLAGI